MANDADCLGEGKIKKERKKEGVAASRGRARGQNFQRKGGKWGTKE